MKVMPLQDISKTIVLFSYNRQEQHGVLADMWAVSEMNATIFTAWRGILENYWNFVRIILYYIVK